MRQGLISLFLILSPAASAGYVELSGSANYRESKINKDNYQKLISFTGSISYYFWELSAIELSYTEGEQIVRIQPVGGEYTLVTTQFRMAGLDFVLTLAGKQSPFQPYIKFGGAYVDKKIFSKTEIGGQKSIPYDPGVVPSAGIGFRIKFTNTLALKVGVDGWTTPLDQDPVTVDYAGRAGISWMF